MKKLVKYIEKDMFKGLSTQQQINRDAVIEDFQSVLALGSNKTDIPGMQGKVLFVQGLFAGSGEHIDDFEVSVAVLKSRCVAVVFAQVDRSREKRDQGMREEHHPAWLSCLELCPRLFPEKILSIRLRIEERLIQRGIY
ncbi:hypothetical protein [Shuttleworthella sp. MSX8B]|uniref:hypothetical protein n=1 Tax=Shuttleworthella sp. MSX8B TaxID=936574 RepID=UPI0012EBCEA1|nr:hypothetical protein [Shuttleworthia sp. MSX8B]